MNSSPAPGRPAGNVIAAGTVIGGRYTVDSMLGRGGMAAVYRATDVPLGRSVALKVFSVDTEGAGLGRESSEIQLLASLNHHALVTLFDANVDGDDQSYLVMELVEGPTLKERIEQGPIPEIDVAQMLVDLAEALHVVHGNGVVHRDVKPANILLSASVSRALGFRAKLSDFGIAYLIDSTRLTMPGTIIGTAAYLSPEQARGAAPGPASDIYSLGLVALESLTGVRAFEGSMIESISARLVGDPAIPGSLGGAWVSLLSSMTDRMPEARPSALEVAELASAIERELYSGSTGDTAVMPASSEASELTQPMAADDAPDAPTRVMPARTADDEKTSLLPSVAAPTPTVGESAERSLPKRPLLSRRPFARRVALVSAALLVAVGVGAFAYGAATTSGNAQPSSTPVPSLPANDGELATHLDELLESVTP